MVGDVKYKKCQICSVLVVMAETMEIVMQSNQMINLERKACKV
jgi:hypothetical protein